MSDSRPNAAPSRPRLVIVATHPIQYYAPLYRRLAERGIIDLEVIYLSDAGAKAHKDPGFARTVEWDVPLLDGYAHRILQPGTNITARRFWQMHDRHLTTALASAHPDWLLVYGYASRMNWAAVHWARRNGVRVMYTSDSNSRNPERFVPIKKRVIGHFFRQVDIFLSPSERNVEYLLRYGTNTSCIVRIPFAIDTARFTPANNVDATDRYDFIWVGKFVRRKRGRDFIDALDHIARCSNRSIRACIVGDGPCREDLRRRAARLPANCAVTFSGFVNQRAMPSLLQSAHTMVFSSEREPYGLVATEAAAAGLALVVANTIGCVGATVVAQPGVNAVIYPTGNVPDLAAAMTRVLDDPALLTRMQRASLDIATYHDVDCAASVIERVVIGGSK